MAEHMRGHSLYLEEKDVTRLWKWSDLNDQGMNAASVYLQRCAQNSPFPGASHVAIYCRRNDIAKVVKDRMGEKTLFDSDEEMWCEVEDAIQLKRIVHFITDDKAYSYRAYELFHDRINYGLHWDHLADTKEVLCKRSTKFQDAIDDFAIMQKCTLVYGHSLAKQGIYIYII